ncbi:hypothetical protein H7X46_22675 [Pseudonocardia sp. C8]|uniref:hypothetical protein n=1 Tax=Pseudonocardia sp. C8 TaxID=2762759 RepID=UPI0016432CF9|nr:hypothetical protein [Pseudonocardia sp. C8]MBC3193870.1 hypothetical protein [Pseudonocardia sp. C8]
MSNPAPARTDVDPLGTPATAPGVAAPALGTTRRIGTGLALGATAFGLSFLVGDPQDAGGAGDFTDAGGLLFQFGLFGLLYLMRRTRATGDGRFGRGLLWTVTALLVPATAWSALAIVVPADARGTWFVVLDLFWPLSMLGMAVIGVTIAVVGRYRGILRFWPAVAETWAVVTVPVLGVLGPAVGNAVGGLHMILGYGVLGLLVATRPQRLGVR